MSNMQKIQYVANNIAGTIGRAQRWMPADMIFGTKDDILVETLWEAANLENMTFDSAYASYKNYKIHQLLPVDDALLFYRVKHYMFQGWEMIKQGATIEEVKTKLDSKFPPNASQEMKDLVWFYLQVCADNVSSLGDETEPPERYKQKIREFKALKHSDSSRSSR